MDTCPSPSDLVGAAVSRRLIAVVHMDMAGYSRLIGLDAEATIAQFNEIRTTLIDPAVHDHGGRVAQTAGDSLLITFDSIDGAIGCAVKVQREMPLFDGMYLPGQRMRFRIGVEIGDVIGAGRELHGNGINVAARLQAACAVGGICVSGVVREHMRHRPDLEFEPLGALRLKNIARPVEAFQLRLDPPCILPAAGPGRRMPRVGPRAAAAGAVAAALVLLPAAAWQAAPRVRAERLLHEGLAIACTQPCPRAWLARRALFAQAIAADPGFARPYAEAAFTYANFISAHLSVDRDEDFRAAARLATAAVALAPDDALAQEARGAVLRQDRDKLEDALSAFQRAMALAPERPWARANAGWVLVLLGRPAEAEPYLRAALAADPDNQYAPAWLNYLGLAELFLGHYADGAALFRQAIARQPPTAAAADVVLERQLNLAAAMALDGDVATARRMVAGLRIDHPALSTHNMMGNCDCSRAPGFLAGQAVLRRGAALAGVLDEG